MINKIYNIAIKLSIFSIALLGVWLFLVLCFKSSDAFSTFGVGFLFDSTWDISKNHFGASAPIYATLLSMALAMFFAMPVALGVAVFLTHILKQRFKSFFIKKTLQKELKQSKSLHFYTKYSSVFELNNTKIFAIRVNYENPNIIHSNNKIIIVPKP